MIEFDISSEVGIEAARIFDELAENDVIGAARMAESYLNLHCDQEFRGFAIAAFNSNVEGQVEAIVINEGQQRSKIMLELAPPLSTPWFAKINQSSLLSWFEPEPRLSSLST
jgi:hypothetical protein